MAGVEVIIHLIPNFVQHVTSCDLLTQLWQRLQWRQDKHFIIGVAVQKRSYMELSLVILGAIFVM